MHSTALFDDAFRCLVRLAWLLQAIIRRNGVDGHDAYKSVLPPLTAHRGAALHAPENSLEGFEQAA